MARDYTSLRRSSNLLPVGLGTQRGRLILACCTGACMFVHREICNVTDEVSEGHLIGHPTPPDAVKSILFRDQFWDVE